MAEHNGSKAMFILLFTSMVIITGVSTNRYNDQRLTKEDTIQFIRKETTDLCGGYPSHYCVCSRIDRGGIVATCTNGDFRKLLELLPDSLVSLVYRVEYFAENGGKFSRFKRLESLKILWTHGPKDLPHVEPYRFNNSELFNGLSALTTLIINIPTYALTSSLLLPLENLQILDLSNTGYLNTSTFANLYKDSLLKHKPIHTLSLNRIAGVNEDEFGSFLLKDLFYLFQASQITSFSFGYNGNVYLYPGLIKYLPNVEYFRLPGNQLRYTKDNPAEANCAIIEIGLHETIRLLDISGMKTIGFKLDFFGTTFITKVFACWLITPKRNCICHTFQSMCSSMVGKMTCDHVPNYKFVDLFNSTCLLNGQLPLPRSMEWIYVNNTQFTFIASPKFQRRVVCFKPSKLKVLSVGEIGFPLGSTGGNMTIYGWDNLTELDVQDSSWGYFFHNPEFIQTMPKLEIFRATGTNIGIYIKNDTTEEIFKMSASMRELYLDNASISHIPGNEFSNMISLTKLYLGNNGLSNISIHLTDLPSLTYLDISDNLFYTLSTPLRSQLEYLSTRQKLQVNLSGNKLLCDCNSLDFVTWFQSTSIDFINKDKYLCSSPASGDVTLSAVNVTLLTMYCYKWYIIAGSCGLFVLLCLLIACIIYKCRRRIGYCCLWVTVELDEEECEIDAFVIYSDEDRFFVHDTMLPKVENEMGLKLAVHHRDFIPGHYIDNQIVDFIHKSRKTIAILSESFLDSSWCDYELQVARHRLQTEGKDVIVPIILSELPEIKKSSSLKQILSEKTYLEWEEDNEAKKYFWKKLRLAIKKKVKSRYSAGSSESPLQNIPEPPNTNLEPPVYVDSESDGHNGEDNDNAPLIPNP